MGQVFFIPAQEIKGCGKNIEGEVAFCCKKGFVTVVFKTFNGLRGDAGFEEQRHGAEREYGRRHRFKIGIIDPKAGGGKELFLICCDTDRSIEEFPAKKSDYIR